MTTRIIENIITAVIAAVGGGYFVLHIAIAEDRVRLDNLERAVASHISEERDDRKEILVAINQVKRCLMERTCTK
jgi:hypothetical protein